VPSVVPQNPEFYDDAYQAAVADARFLMRRAFRMIDEEARKVGLDPLENQLLVQLRGAPALTRSVSDLASRLDVALGLVSRLAKELERRKLVFRKQSPDDGRVTLVCALAKGENLAIAVAENVQARFKTLQDEFSEEHRRAALQVWANNFGVGISRRLKSKV
jgi:DNA-binding MarR family transcriptional regulator